MKKIKNKWIIAVSIIVVLLLVGYFVPIGSYSPIQPYNLCWEGGSRAELIRGQTLAKVKALDQLAHSLNEACLEPSHTVREYIL